MARRLGQNRIEYGQLCTCNECKAPLLKTHDNFYFNKDGSIRKYICKPCDYDIEKARLYKRRALGSNKIQAKVNEVIVNVIEHRFNTRIFPKGHPMNPTKEQRQALIDKIESKRYYKDESLPEM